MHTNKVFVEYSSRQKEDLSTYSSTPAIDEDYIEGEKQESNYNDTPAKRAVFDFRIPSDSGSKSDINKTKTRKEWAEIYKETVQYPISYETECNVYHLRTGDPNAARRIRRKARYYELSTRLLWGPCPQWYFGAEFRSRRNAIRSLSRILRQECYWDEKRCEIKVLPNSQGKGMAS